MTTATIIRLSDHAGPARRSKDSGTALVVPFVTRRAVLSVQAEEAREALSSLRAASEAASATVASAVARGAPEGELRALRRIASKARIAASLATARAVCTALEASAA